MNIRQQSTCFEKYFIMGKKKCHTDHGLSLSLSLSLSPHPPEATTDGETEEQLSDSSGGLA